jgi:hypothetical protein
LTRKPCSIVSDRWALSGTNWRARFSLSALCRHAVKGRGERASGELPETAPQTEHQSMPACVSSGYRPPMWQTALRALLLRYLLRVSPVASKNDLIFISPAMTSSMR